MTLEDFVRPQISSSAAAGRFRDAVDLLSSAARLPVLAEGFPTFAPELLDVHPTAFSAAEIELMERHQRTSFYWIARNRTIAWLVRRYFADARMVLDIGCGSGYVTQALVDNLPEARIYATEASIEGLRAAARKLENRVFMLHIDARDIPFEGNFDLITSFDVLEHIDDDQSVLESIYRALRPGGGVLHFVPQHPALFSPADDASHHFRRYRLTELQGKLRSAGFRVVFSTSFVFWLFPIFAASRVKARLTSRYSVEAEHEQPRWLSSILNGVQAMELALLKCGISYPVGVSRAVVAVRD
ncbi:MAG: class I SAM-dependent methyltransferase [Alphaproteobacteria bacterium]